MSSVSPPNDSQGVILHKINGKNHVLVTDRNHGLSDFDV